MTDVVEFAICHNRNGQKASQGKKTTDGKKNHRKANFIGGGGGADKKMEGWFGPTKGGSKRQRRKRELWNFSAVSVRVY